MIYAFHTSDGWLLFSMLDSTLGIGDDTWAQAHGPLTTRIRATPSMIQRLYGVARPEMATRRNAALRLAGLE